jgi:hypothetical protein
MPCFNRLFLFKSKYRIFICSITTFESISEFSQKLLRTLCHYSQSRLRALCYLQQEYHHDEHAHFCIRAPLSENPVIIGLRGIGPVQRFLSNCIV